MKNTVNTKEENDIYEHAWLLWNKANDIANELWQAFEQHFILKKIDRDEKEYQKLLIRMKKNTKKDG